ncbi:LysE family translocator (plasmid) [Tistrella mobilis]|uniref:LysE family translocator n=1 Tax=Tistrella mobilis TaxID=171437 RepID=UPI0035564879
MDLQTILTFTIAFFVFAASPGPDNVTILSKTVADGPAHGLAYGAGVVTSIFGVVILAAIGFHALAQAMNEQLAFVQYPGAAWLVWMGISMWRAAPVITPRATSGGVFRLYITGFLLNVSNPKMPIFYLALLPGALGVRPLGVADTALLLAIIAAVEVVVVGGHVLIGMKARSLLDRPARIRALNRGAGSLMIAAAAVVAAR